MGNVDLIARRAIAPALDVLDEPGREWQSSLTSAIAATVSSAPPSVCPPSLPRAPAARLGGAASSGSARFAARISTIARLAKGFRKRRPRREPAGRRMRYRDVQIPSPRSRNDEAKRFSFGS
jgi:hypothetical protein